MQTPVFDFVRHYQASRTARLHMPGHKGRGPLGCEGLDITEVQGADALFEAEGILAQSEANATRLFGSGASFYSTEGSSHCIRAMLWLAGQCAPAGARPLVLAARNAHRAFLTACALLDWDVAWLYPAPTAEASLCSCPIAPEQVEQALAALPQKPLALYVTSPDYLGHLADLPALARVCHRHGLLLLVDNAHGAYLHFLPQPCHPLDLGADLCCDSAHKTLPVLTGGAYLHISRALAPRLAPAAKTGLALFGSTSPSYLILQSLDLCNRRLAEDWPAALARTAQALQDCKARLTQAGLAVEPGEPLKLVLRAAPLGLTGQALAQHLRRSGLEPEFADLDFLVCMLTPENPPQDLERLEQALLALPRRPALSPSPGMAPCPLPRAMSIRRAMLAPSRELPLEQALGRVCAAPAVSCPPAIALAVCGEVLTEQALALFRAYGLDRVRVVWEQAAPPGKSLAAPFFSGGESAMIEPDGS